MPPRLDLDYVCRLCLILVDSARNGQLAPLFREEQSLELARKIADIAGVKVVSGDGLPGQVCRSCMEQVEACYTFVQKCRNADLYFRQYLSADDYTNCTLPAASGEESILMTSECATDYKCIKPEMSEADQPIDVSIVKEEAEIVKEHYMTQADEEGITTEAYKLESDLKVSAVDGNYGVVTKGKPAGYARGVKRGLFPCDLCPKALGSAGSLRVHRLNHSGLRPFCCAVEGCTKRFSQYGNLQTHVRSHLGIRPYVCTACDARFVQLANLRSHERKHARCWITSIR